VTSFNNTYVITNRTTPQATSYESITPLPGGAMWFFAPTGQYNNELTDYNDPIGGQSSPTAPSDFVTALENDLQIAISNGCPQLTVFIHGLGYTLGSVVNYLNVLGTGLQQYQIDYGGLVIAFDWPSYDFVDSGLNYGPDWVFPPAAKSGSIRGNIGASVDAFSNLLLMLAGIQKTLPAIQVNFICHSEGNYMLMTGMFDQSPSPSLNQVLLVAADINNAALGTSTTPADAGEALPIAGSSDRVTVYFSSGDDVLPDSQEDFVKSHNPNYPDRLGLVGPYSFPDLAPNACGVDCSSVINDATIKNISQVPAGTDSHSSYFYIPQVLEDWAQTLLGTPSAQVVNRQATTNPNDFTMPFVTPPAGLRLQRRNAG
jgi:hypothetical protein